MTAEPLAETPTCPARDWRTQFDLADAEFGNEFDQIADDLVANCPAARTVDDEWVISRHADVTRMMLEADLFSSGSGIRGAKFQPRPEELLKPNEMDQPEHGWLRHSWDRHFTRSAIAQHEPAIRDIVHELIDGFASQSEVDVVAQFGDPLACRAFCQAVANMPVEDMPFLQKAFQAALTAPTVEARTQNWMATHEYVGRFLEQRKREPRRDDIVDTILHFEYPDGRTYSTGERASSLMQVTAAGLVTTGAIVSGAILHLAGHPEDRRRLAEDRSLLPTAIEEFLRVYVAAPVIGRRATADTELAGASIRKGDFVWYNIGGANRDPSVIPDPDRVDITRKANKHLTFATGRHRCLGPEFARMNIRVALDTFLDRVEEFSLPADFTARWEAGMTRRLTALPLRVTVRSR